MVSKAKRGPKNAAFGNGGWGVRVTAASRLSFTLIDLSAHGGRKNGMASLALRDPSFRATVTPAFRTTVTGDDEIGAQYAPDIRRLLAGSARKWRTLPAEVRIETGLIPHVGLGSKTTTLLAVGQAYSLLNKAGISTELLAKIARRGRTSGASVNLIDRGGFLVDGGHKAPIDLAANPRAHLRPSRFAPLAAKPPVLINQEFPPWPIALILPVGNKIHGELEASWFREITPIPINEARKTAHLILLHLAPAIAECDYEAFCRAVNTLTAESYYKRKQIARQSPSVRHLLREGLKRSEVDAIGMSSMGPCCYAFTRRPDALVSWLNELHEAGVLTRYWFSSAQNHPAVLEGVPSTLDS